MLQEESLRMKEALGVRRFQDQTTHGADFDKNGDILVLCRGLLIRSGGFAGHFDRNQ